MPTLGQEWQISTIDFQGSMRKSQFLCFVNDKEEGALRVTANSTCFAHSFFSFAYTMTYSSRPFPSIKNKLIRSSWPCFRLLMKEQKVTTFSQSFFLTCLDQHTALSDLVVLTWDSSSSHSRPHINENQMKGSWLELPLNFKRKCTKATTELELPLK